ncbi:hypothetical protein M3Y99_01291400 [Aphelenchoides fujianensis]|nr:hypothetical protein M3Y99_01291400 [Aphelenchoides fujianensis]
MLQLLTIRRFYVYYTLVMGVISYFLNVLAPRMRSYAMIIVVSAILDLFYCTVNTIAVESVDMRDGVMLIFSLGFFSNVPHPFPIIACIAWMFALLLLVVNLPLQFYYRYHRCPNAMAILLVCVRRLSSSTFLAQALGFLLVYHYEKADVQQHQWILQKSPLYSTDPPEKSRGCWSALCNTQFIVAGSYVAVSFFAVKIYRLLKEKRPQMSENTRQLQQQLTRIMCIQVLYPLVVFGFPIVLTCLCSVFHWDFPLLGIVCSYLCTFITVANPLSVILVVPSFRHAVFGSAGMRGTQVTTQSASKGFEVTCGRVNEGISSNLFFVLLRKRIVVMTFE